MTITNQALQWSWALGGLILSASCVSSSSRSDLNRVTELSRAEDLAEIVDGDVEAVSDDDVNDMLKKPLSIQTASKIALLNNRELRAKLQLMGVSRGRLKQAALLPNPRAEVEYLPEQDSDFELRLEYDITDAILAPLRARSFEPQLDAARYDTAAAVIELGFNVRAQYIRVQAAEQKLAVAKKLLDAYAAGHDAAVALRQSGSVRELDEAQQHVALEKERIRVAELELARLLEREALHRMLGVHGAATEWKIDAALEPAPATLPVPEDLETKALRANLALKERRQQIESLARRAGFADASGWIPDVAVDVHALRSNDEAATPRDDWRLGAGVSFSVPLFDRNQGEAMALQAEGDAMLERYYGLAVDLRSAARQVRGRLSSAHARAVQYHDVIAPAQTRLAEQMLLQYNAMQVGVFDLLRAKREQLEVELSRIDALMQYWIAHAAFQALLAGVSVSNVEVASAPAARHDNAISGGHP